MKINRDLIRESIYKKYMPYIKPDNKRIATSIINMACCDLGIKERQVFNLLAGEKISLSLLKKVIEIYDISPDEIFINE